MPADFLFWLAFFIKLVLTAGIVVTASFVTERAGPLIGALVVTLPVTVWPAYVFLSLDHDVAFVAQSAATGLAVHAATGIFMLVYAVLARAYGLATSMLVALAVWVGLAYLARSSEWSITGVLAANVVAYAGCILLSDRFRHVKMPPIFRRWYDLPFRTLLVCVLMGTMLLVSRSAGPVATGMIAVFPISTTSTMLILHPRIGGQVTAAVVANGLWGMVGIGLGLSGLCMAVEPLGKAPGLALALLIPLLWNYTVWSVRTRRWLMR